VTYFFDFDQKPPIFIFSPGRLPTIVKNAGYFSTGTYPADPPEFDLKSGPREGREDKSPLGIWLAFFQAGFLTHIMASAPAKKKALGLSIAVKLGDLMRYITYILAAGLVGYRQERAPFRREITHGLFRNDFFTSLLDYAQLLKYKKIFTGSRQRMTKIFNDTSKKFWIPSQ
jgi:hypothetical protein